MEGRVSKIETKLHVNGSRGGGRRARPAGAAPALDAICGTTPLQSKPTLYSALSVMGHEIGIVLEHCRCSICPEHTVYFTFIAAV